MLINSSPGSEQEYTSMIAGIKDYKGEFVTAFPNPGLMDIAGGKIAFFFINGFFYFIRIEPKCEFALFDTFLIKETHEIEIPLLSGRMAKKLLDTFALPGHISDFFLFKHYTPK